MTWTYEHTFKLPGAPERVYQAWTDARALARWFAEHADLHIAPGGKYRFWGRHTLGSPTQSEADQRITRLEAGKLLAFSWRLYHVDTEVMLAFTPGEEGTELSLRHQISGDLGVKRSRELIDDLWRLSCGNLQRHLDGGSGIVLPDYADPKPEVRMTVSIAAPPEAVFRALIEPGAIVKWFGTESATVEPRVGGRYDLHWSYKVDGKDVTGGPTHILEFEQNRKLTLAWPDWRGDESVTGQTITFALEPEGKGTRVTLVHAGFTRTTDISDYPFGWPFFVDGLKREAENLMLGHER
jgi:uncharacterized protein YndB with AHSA1/START domain